MMGLDFTVAITPSATNIDRELQYIKSALLYADSITLISPVAYLFTKLGMLDDPKDVRAVIRMLEYSLPIVRDQNPDLYLQGTNAIRQLKPILNSKKYRLLPAVTKMEFQQMLTQFAKSVDDALLPFIGEQQSRELENLIKAGRVHLQKFEHDLTDFGGLAIEYYKHVKEAVKTSYPLFDEQSNDLLELAVKSKLIRLNEVEQRKITHAGASDNIIQRLPAFEDATIDEILDIRKELENPLIRFRGKMLAYTEDIQLMPWDEDFAEECSILYYKEIAPAVLEISELTQENSFLKNLGEELVSDGQFMKSAGGLIVSIAAAGVIPSLTDAISTDVSIIGTAAAFGATKVAAAYNKYSSKKKEIEKKDMFFYYKAGTLLRH